VALPYVYVACRRRAPVLRRQERSLGEDVGPRDRGHAEREPGQQHEHARQGLKTQVERIGLAAPCRARAALVGVEAERLERPPAAAGPRAQPRAEGFVVRVSFGRGLSARAIFFFFSLSARHLSGVSGGVVVHLFRDSTKGGSTSAASLESCVVLGGRGYLSLVFFFHLSHHALLHCAVAKRSGLSQRRAAALLPQRRVRDEPPRAVEVPLHARVVGGAVLRVTDALLHLAGRRSEQGPNVRSHYGPA